MSEGVRDGGDGAVDGDSGMDGGGVARSADQAPATGGAGADDQAQSGVEIPRHFTRDGVDPFDEVEWERRTATIANERGEVIFEQRDCEIPSGLQVLPRPPRYARARDQRAATHWPRGRAHSRMGRARRLLPHPRLWRALSRGAFAPARHAEDGVQQPRLVQPRRRDTQAAGERVLHQLRRRHHGIDHGAREDRGHALQGRLRHGLQPLEHPLLA